MGGARPTASGGEAAGTALRAAAAHAVHAVVHRGRSLDDALPEAARRHRIHARDQALLSAMAYGVLRHYRRLGWQLDRLLDKPLRDAPLLDALLRVGLLQCLDLRIPDHAATSATTSAVERLDLGWARALVNAVLRRCQEDPAALTPPDDAALLHSWPDWLVEQIRADWGEAADAVFEGGNQQAPMTLRVNRRRMRAADYLARLQAQGIDAALLPGAEDAVVLDQPRAVDALPGFARGSVSVQDASAQLAADLLDLHPGQRLLDACSAPGGKTAHALEREPSLRVTALDTDRSRLARVDETLRRIGLKATLAGADAIDTRRWWDGQPYDRILVDAPCSGTGVVRRHPDIKWLRRASDIDVMAQRQRALLDALWPLLLPGGRLVFATCSILSAEGEAVVSAFLDHTTDAEPVRTALPVGSASGAGWRIAPGGAWDGFYYATLVKADR